MSGRTELRNISVITSAETEIVKPLACLSERARVREKERKVLENGVLRVPTPRSGQFTYGERYELASYPRLGSIGLHESDCVSLTLIRFMRGNFPLTYSRINLSRYMFDRVGKHLQSYRIHR